jgi:hypothetical protein
MCTAAFLRGEGDVSDGAKPERINQPLGWGCGEVIVSGGEIPSKSADRGCIGSLETSLNITSLNISWSIDSLEISISLENRHLPQHLLPQHQHIRTLGHLQSKIEVQAIPFLLNKMHTTEHLHVHL